MMCFVQIYLKIGMLRQEEGTKINANKQRKTSHFLIPLKEEILAF